jgi:oligopeptide transport system substrate-binding protein
VSRLLPVLCLVASILVGCGAPAVAPVVHHPQAIRSTLHWGLVGLTDIPTLDPALSSDTASIEMASLLYGGLVRLDAHLRVRPDGASRWRVSPNGRTYTFTIRKHLRFADGKPVTAADFASAFERALGPEASAGTGPFYLSLVARTRSGVPDIVALNAHTIRITLKHAAAHFLSELAFPSSFVPDPSLQERYGSEWTDHAAGFGPYEVASWEHGRALTLVANPYYYAGRPHIRRIRVAIYPQPASALADYRRGTLDLVSGFAPGGMLPSSLAGRVRVPALALDYLAFNTARFPFHHINARRAFADIPAQRLAADAMGSAAFPARGLLPPAFGLRTRPWRPSRPPRTYLHRAHYKNSSDFPPIALAVPRDRRVYDLALALKTAWEVRLGISVVVRQLDASTYGQALDQRAFDLAFVRWGADYADPEDFLGTQLGSAATNVTGWKTPTYDSTIKLADSLPPANLTRMVLYERAARLASRKVALLPLDDPAETAVISPQLHGVELSPLGTISASWSSVHLDP